MKVFRLVAVALLASVATAQTYTNPNTQVPIGGPLRSNYGGSAAGDKMLDVRDLDGVYVKSITRASNTITVTFQDSSNAQDTLAFTLGSGGGGGGDPLESGSYDESTEELTLTLQSGTDVTIGVSDLVTADELTDALGLISATVTTSAPVSGDGSAGDPVTIADGAIDDEKISGLSATKLTDTIADARIPAAIARDSELPDVSTYLERSDIVAGANVTLTPGSGNSVTIAATASGGGGSDGVVDGVTFNEATGEITLGRTIGADITRKIDEILRVASGDTLPTAADNEGRIAVSGNALFESRFVVTEAAHSRSVTLMTLPVGGVTISGTVYGNNYAGNFAAAPLATNYSLNEFIWDRGSEVWLLNATSSLGARHWLSYSGPAHFRHGVYYSDANAGSHANGVGEIFIVGSGSSQLVRYVSSFTAATAEQSGWLWQGLGTDLAGIESVITGRLSGNAPPAIGITGNPGSSTDIARSDHHHLGQTSVTVANAITARLSDDAPEAVGTASDAGTGTDASRGDHIHERAPLSWGVQIDTQIVPEANENAITAPRISLRTSGLTHYLAFLDWTAASLSRIDHLPVGGHIGLRQGSNTRILRVEDAWDSTENRYHVTNTNSAPLTESSSGTATELLLTVQPEPDGVVTGGSVAGTDLTLTRSVGGDVTITGLPSGGSGGSDSTELWTGDIAIATSNTWTAAGTDVVPASATWLLFNGGTLTSGTDDGAPADWKWVNATAWRGLTASSATSTVADGTAMQFAEWSSTDVESTNFTRRDVKIGRTSTNTVLIASMDAGEDFNGAAIRYITGFGGGGFELHSGAADPASTVGADGDWYLNTTDGTWFEKASGAWGSAVYTDMVGAAGGGQTESEVNALISTHNTSTTAHNDIRSDLSDAEDRLDALDPVEIEAYDSTATYSRGSANSIVTHDNHVWVYRSTQRNTDHDPEQYPQYWFKLDTPIRVLNHDSATVTHWRSGDIFLTETGEVRLATATISSSPADIISIHTGADQEFLWLNESGGGGGAQASDATPEQIGETGAAGTATPYSREDHVHIGVSRITPGVGISVNRNHGNVTVTSTGGGTFTGLTDTPAALGTAGEIVQMNSAGDALEFAAAPSGTGITQDAADGRYLNEASNLSDLDNAGTARTNLGLGDAATLDYGLGENHVPILDANGDLNVSVIPGTIARLASPALTGNPTAPTQSAGNDSTRIATTAFVQAEPVGEGQIGIDNTMQFDSDGDLGVNTERVVQTVSEWVQHFASGDSHDTSGHTGKYHEYTSSNTVRRIGSVQYDFDPDNDSDNKTYRVYIIELTGRNVDAVLGVSQTYSGNSQQHRFHFTDGVTINPAVRIGIGLHRTDGGGNNYGLSVRAGTESQDSPRESYDDASDDFHFEGRFNHDRNFPSVNDTVGGTAANQIYGNPEIFYQIIHTHESLVGDGNISVSHISSGSSADGTVLTADGSGGVAFEVATGSGLSESEVDARVTAGVLDWAETGNTDDVPVGKIPGGITHIESGGTYNNNVISVSTSETVRGGDGILFAVPSPFGTSSTQAISLEINGQANSEFPLHDRNGDALHEDDLTVNSLYIAISDADSWDILVLPSGDSVADNRLIPDGGTDGQVLTKASGTDYDTGWEDAASGSGGSGAVTLTPEAAADKNFSQTTGLGTNQNGVAQNNDLFDTDITLPTDIPDNELFYLRAIGNIGENLIGLTKAHLDELTPVTPVTWVTTFTNGVTADRDGDDRNAFSFPIGQNRGLLIGISNETPYRLQWGSTNTGTFVDLQIVTVTAGSGESGEESPGNPGVAERTPDLVTIVLWQWFEDAVTPIPDDPTAHWRFDDEWDGTTPFQGGGWYTSRGTALDEADNNLDFSQSTWSLWIATEQVRRRVVNDAYTYTDGGYSLISVFDDQYSANSNGPWTTTYDSATHNWMRMRNSIGEYTPAIAIGDTTGVEWETFLSEAAVYQRGPQSSSHNTHTFSPAVDISGYDAILIQFQSFDTNNTDGAHDFTNLGEVIISQPPGGWLVTSTENSWLTDGTYQYVYDAREFTPLQVSMLDDGQFTNLVDGDGNITSQTYTGPGIPNSVRDATKGHYLVTAGRFKLIGSGDDDVTGFRVFDNPANNNNYNRSRWWMSGLK